MNIFIEMYMRHVVNIFIDMDTQVLSTKSIKTHQFIAFTGFYGEKWIFCLSNCR